MTNVNVKAIAEALNTVETRAEARELLNPLKVKELKEVASIAFPCLRRTNKADWIDGLVENTVGARLKFDALLNTPLGSQLDIIARQQPVKGTAIF